MPACQREGCANESRTSRSKTKGRYCSKSCNAKVWRQSFRDRHGYEYDGAESWTDRQARKWRELRRLEAVLGPEAT